MKTFGKGTSFSFSAINAGQRNTSVEPQLIAVSTEGNFRITPPVSRALGISHGEYIMFLSSVDNIDAAIINNAPEIVEFCTENNLELGSTEAIIAIHKEFDEFAIAKGIMEFDTKGNAKEVSERLTKKDKMKFVSQNFDNMLEQAVAQADDEIKAALTREGISKEEQMDILSSFVKPRELPKYKGSKTANPGQLTGAGVALTFTDSNVWKQLKADMGEEATDMNRVFDVDIENIQDITISDGFKEVSIKALILGDYTDKEPSRIGSGNDDDENAE